MNKNTTYKMATVAIIAALYTVVSLALAPITYGPIQVRIAEGLTLLPLIMPEAIFGVTVGCFLTNLVGALTGTNLLGFLDVAIGTAATLLAALITYYFRNKKIGKIPLISIAAPIIVNAIIIGAELFFTLFPTTGINGFVINVLQVGFGQLIAVIVIGIPIVIKLEKILKKR